MRLLVRPEPYCDESLESYLLRLSQENGFESFRLFGGSVRDWLLQQDHEAAGAFPLDLFRVNVFHASRSSGLRIRALRLVEQLTDLAPSSLLQLALLHSGLHFGSGHKAVHRAGVDIPLCFIRTRSIPCCPACLNESAYVRQHWYYAPYHACHVHATELLYACPHCGSVLDYTRSESITHCLCGYDLRMAKPAPADRAVVQLAELLCGERFESDNPLLANEQPTVRFGALLWYWLRHFHSQDDKPQDLRVAEAIGYFADWPANFHAELRQQVQSALLKQTRLLNHTAFSEVFGSVLGDCRQLPMRDIRTNFILRGLLDYLTSLVFDNPKRRVGNLADILLSAVETAAVLSTSVEQVYRLQQEGYLTPAYRLRRHDGLTAHEPIFHLRQVIEHRLAHGSRGQDPFHCYLPAW